jgi:hypothetical protein
MTEMMTEITNLTTAFSADQVVRLTSLSMRQWLIGISLALPIGSNEQRRYWLIRDLGPVKGAGRD